MLTSGESRKGREGWLLACRYPDMDAAGRAYSAARDIVFSEDIDASVYRILIRSVPHVVVLGDGGLPATTTESWFAVTHPPVTVAGGASHK